LVKWSKPSPITLHSENENRKRYRSYTRNDRLQKLNPAVVWNNLRFDNTQIINNCVVVKGRTIKRKQYRVYEDEQRFGSYSLHSIYERHSYNSSKTRRIIGTPNRITHSFESLKKKLLQPRHLNVKNFDSELNNLFKSSELREVNLNNYLFTRLKRTRKGAKNTRLKQISPLALKISKLPKKSELQQAKPILQKKSPDKQKRELSSWTLSMNESDGL